MPELTEAEMLAARLAAQDTATDDRLGEIGLSTKKQILSAASAGQNSGWVPISPNLERLFYQLDSGTTSTQFSVDISADGVNSLGQAFTGTWAASASGEFTPPLMFSNPLAKFYRFNVVAGGPLSVYRNA